MSNTLRMILWSVYLFVGTGAYALFHYFVFVKPENRKWDEGKDDTPVVLAMIFLVLMTAFLIFTEGP